MAVCCVVSSKSSAVPTTLTYSLGVAGNGGVGYAAGGNGTSTSLTYKGTTLVANGGLGGIYTNSNGVGSAATYSGGDGGVNGGKNSGGTWGGGGGAVCYKSWAF